MPPRAPRRKIGPVERQVKRDIGALMTAHPMGEALAAMSLTLAWAVDHIRETGKNLVALSATNRELRDNLTELARLAVNDADDFADELSAPVRDEKKP
jgi:hypothetical protein